MTLTENSQYGLYVNTPSADDVVRVYDSHIDKNKRILASDAPARGVDVDFGTAFFMDTTMNENDHGFEADNGATSTLVSSEVKDNYFVNLLISDGQNNQSPPAVFLFNIDACRTKDDDGVDVVDTTTGPSTITQAVNCREAYSDDTRSGRIVTPAANSEIANYCACTNC